ncbi:hypothetical protein Glove_33g134 [Diversispora epigaea]|uniref:MD-2-related lipid-recognition domain-containing protein n=1 Tax=Diversispora epigaea TaxID=1348612 RepID=A0A397JT21_9GLOM|nr:hypothetical protein Glove_33g134 [Diversispora epigaea]
MQIVKEISTLSVVNALPHQLSKRETQWEQCTDLGNRTSLLGVTISPDPLVKSKNGTFSVSGDFESGNGLPACPIKPFKVDFIIQVPERLPNPYLLVVVFGNRIARKIYGCALTQVGGGSEESYPIASYPIASYPIASYPIASYPIAE